MSEAGGRDLGAARDRIRESAKWLTASVGAVAAVMVAGSQLSGLGDLEVGGTRFVLAIIGGLLAVLGVGGALWATISTLTAPAVGLTMLATEPPDSVTSTLTDATLLGGRADVAQLRADYLEALSRRVTAFARHHADPDDAALRTAAQAADAQAVGLAQTVSTLLDVAAYDDLAATWRADRRVLLLGAAVAAVGIAAFAWASNPPEDAEGTAIGPVVLDAPTATTMSLTDTGRAALADALGDDCALDGDLAVLLLGGDESGADVVVTQTGCTPTRFVLVPGWGTVGP